MENIINFFLRCVSAVIILSILLLAIGIMAYTWKIWAVGVGAPILSFLTYSIIFQHKYEMNKFQKIMLIILSYMEILGFISLIGTVCWAIFIGNIDMNIIYIILGITIVGSSSVLKLYLDSIGYGRKDINNKK